MFTAAILGAFAAMSGAWAADNELDFELGSLSAPDTDWEMFSSGSAVGTWGIRGGYGLAEHLSVVAGWHHSADGAQIWLDGESSDVADFHTAFLSDQFTVGPKFDYAVTSHLSPYATVQAMLYRGKIRLDTDIEHEGNPNELKFSALAPGAYGALGVEWLPIRLGDRARVGTHLELGYAWVLPMKFKDDNGTQRDENSDKPAFVGQMDFHGFAMRWGVGLRF